MASIFRSLLVVCVLIASSCISGAAIEVGGSDAEIATVELKENVRSDGSVVGIIENHSDHAVNDIRVLVRHSWRWQDEFEPGARDPSRAEYISVPGRLPPGGSVEFHYDPVPQLPDRTDGQFVTTAQIVGFNEITIEIAE